MSVSSRGLPELGHFSSFYSIFTFVILLYPGQNSEVVQRWTMVNAELNLRHWQEEGDRERARKRASFFAGDWADLAPHLMSSTGDAGFDVVLMAETVYAEDSYETLIQLLKAVVRPQTGVVYAAAKTYYFGVGEGQADFMSLRRAAPLIDSTFCLYHLVFQVAARESSKRPWRPPIFLTAAR